jgi:hypothetical protein
MDKKKLRERKSIQQLMGIQGFTDIGMETDHGELVYFLIKPVNLSVLSDESIANRVLTFANLLQGIKSLQLIALDSCETYRSNKDFYQTRAETEALPGIQRLLEQDAQYLDEIQLTTSLDREFGIILHYREPNRPLVDELYRIEKLIQSQGFRVRRAEQQDLMRLLSVYYTRSGSTENFESIDGERLIVL